MPLVSGAQTTSLLQCGTSKCHETKLVIHNLKDDNSNQNIAPLIHAIIYHSPAA
jgi:hypothetical protein